MSASLHMGLVADKIATPEAAVKIVKPGQSVFIGTGCATPVGLVTALEARKPAPPDVELIYFLTSGLSEVWGAARPPMAPMLLRGLGHAPLVAAGKAEYVPISLTKIRN